MLGVPAADEKQIFDWTNVILGAGDPDFGGTFEALFNGALGMYNYAQALGQDRLEHPRDDLIVGPDARRRRRSAAEPGRVRLVLHPAGGGGQRDHPQRDQLGDEDAHRSSPTSSATGRPTLG